MVIRVGGQYIAVLFGLQLPLTRNLSNKVKGIFFLKKSSLVFIYCVNMFMHVYMHIYYMRIQQNNFENDIGVFYAVGRMIFL